MPLPEIQYFLEADVIIDGKDWDKFNAQFPDAGRSARARLESQGILLCHSMKAFTGDEHGNQHPVYYNYWRLGQNMAILTEKQRNLKDDPFWAAFCNSIHKEEEKEIVFPLSKSRSTNVDGFDLNTARYLQIKYDISHFAIPEFGARLDEQIVDAGRANRWLLGNSYAYLTGHEARVVQIWLVPPGQEASMNERVNSLPWLQPAEVFGKPILKPKLPFDGAEPSLVWNLFDRSEFDVNDPVGASAL